MTPDDANAMMWALWLAYGGEALPVAWAVRFAANGGDPLAEAWQVATDDDAMAGILQLVGQLDIAADAWRACGCNDGERLTQEKPPCQRCVVTIRRRGECPPLSVLLDGLGRLTR